MNAASQRKKSIRLDTTEWGKWYTLCKNFKFDHTFKWYMHMSEEIQILRPCQKTKKKYLT